MRARLTAAPLAEAIGRQPAGIPGTPQTPRTSASPPEEGSMTHTERQLVPVGGARRFRCSRCGFESEQQRDADEHVLEANECAAQHYVAR